MPLDIVPILQTLHLTSIFKIGILAVFGLYLIFLFIIYRQVHLMNRVVKQEVVGTFLEFLAFLLILVGVALFLAALAIL